MNNGSFSTGGQAQNPTFGTVVVTAALQLNAGAVFELFNTADKTTNYERLRADWSGNIARIWTGAAGSASARILRVGAGALSGVNPASYIDFASSGPFIQGTTQSTGSTSQPFISWLSTGAASAGVQTAFSITPTYNQSGTAGYTALDVNPTESAAGSGTKLLQRWAVGGTAQAQISSTGVIWAQTLAAYNALAFSTSIGGSASITLLRDADDTLALRRGTNAQTFRGYETFTDAGNYSRWYQAFSGGFAYYGTQAAGTGTRRPLIVQHFTTTLAALPTAATAGAGSRAVISDATAPVFGAVVVGGGAVVSPVYSDGANWIVG